MSFNTTITSQLPYEFTNNRLYLRKGNSEIVIQGWNPPFARRLNQVTNQWEMFQPEFQLVRPYRSKKKGGLSQKEQEAGQMTFDFFEKVDKKPKPTSSSQTLAEQRRKALDRFRFSLPREVGNALEPFRIRQWQLLLLLFHDPGALDLARANPALAYFLAQKLDGDVDLIRSLQCSKMRQREILTLLEYPSSNAAVKLMSKIQPASITSDNWQQIRKLLAIELKKDKTALSHVSKLNLGVMEIVVDPVACSAAGPKLLEEVANDHREKYRGRVIHMIKSALDMQEDLQVRRQVTYFPDLQRLYDVHERITAQFRRRARQLRDVEIATPAGKFDAPPFPGIPGKIEPITNPRDLVDEGEEQGNCVASYAKKILKGNLYIYRVLGPERATLSIIRKKRKWEIGELEAKFNTAASRATEELVSSWLDQHQAERI